MLFFFVLVCILAQAFSSCETNDRLVGLQIFLRRSPNQRTGNTRSRCAVCQHCRCIASCAPPMNLSPIQALHTAPYGSATSSCCLRVLSILSLRPLASFEVNHISSIRIGSRFGLLVGLFYGTKPPVDFRSLWPSQQAWDVPWSIPFSRSQLHRRTRQSQSKAHFATLSCHQRRSPTAHAARRKPCTRPKSRLPLFFAQHIEGDASRWPRTLRTVKSTGKEMKKEKPPGSSCKTIEM